MSSFQLDNPNIAAGALIWLRNWLDVGGMCIDPATKERVLKRVDAVIDDQNVTTADLHAFRSKYPAEKVKEEAKPDLAPGEGFVYKKHWDRAVTILRRARVMPPPRGRMSPDYGIAEQAAFVEGWRAAVEALIADIGPWKD